MAAPLRPVPVPLFVYPRGPGGPADDRVSEPEPVFRYRRAHILSETEDEPVRNEQDARDLADADWDWHRRARWHIFWRAHTTRRRPV